MNNVDTSDKRMKISVAIDDGTSSLSAGRLAHLVTRTVKGPLLSRIHQRRKVLNTLGNFALWPGYGSDRQISPREISISTAYGRVIYSILADRKIGLAVEAGSGFGISGMYILAAIQHCGGVLVSFETGGYWRLAQDSLSAIGPAGIILNEPFEALPERLDRGNKIDFALLDAIHDCENLLRQWDLIAERMNSNGLVIIDDVSFTESTIEWWNGILQSPAIGFAALINQRLGIVELKATHGE